MPSSNESNDGSYLKCKNREVAEWILGIFIVLVALIIFLYSVYSVIQKARKNNFMKIRYETISNI